jgi:regulatory protein
MTAFDRAVKLLAARSRTEQELDRALERAKVPEDERKAALARLRELGYLDDRETARFRARSMVERGDGARKIAQRLAAQGVKAAEASAAVEEAKGELSDDELATRALARKLKGRKPKDDRERHKLLRALIAKGHRPGAAARALGIEWEGDEEIDT